LAMVHCSESDGICNANLVREAVAAAAAVAASAALATCSQSGCLFVEVSQLLELLQQPPSPSPPPHHLPPVTLLLPPFKSLAGVQTLTTPGPASVLCDAPLTRASVTTSAPPPPTPTLLLQACEL
jgi:hypothetical protein